MAGVHPDDTTSLADILRWAADLAESEGWNLNADEGPVGRGLTRFVFGRGGWHYNDFVHGDDWYWSSDDRTLFRIELPERWFS